MAVNQKKVIKRSYGQDRQLMTFSFDKWFMRRLREEAKAKSNKSAFIQDIVCAAMKWKAPPPLLVRKKT